MATRPTDTKETESKDPSQADQGGAAFDGKASAAGVAASMSPDTLPPNAALAISQVDHRPLTAALAGSPQEAAAGIVGAAAAVAAQAVNGPLKAFGQQMDKSLSAIAERAEDLMRQVREDVATAPAPSPPAVPLHPVIEALCGIVARHFPSDAATLRHLIDSPPSITGRDQ